MGIFLIMTGIALLCWGVFLRSLKREPRRLRNGIYLSAALGFSYLAVVLIPGLPVGARQLLTAGLVFVLVPLSAVFLSGFLILNGVVMLRREGRSLGNLLSLFAGLAILGVGTVVVLMGFVQSESAVTRNALFAFGTAVVLIAGYLGYLLCSFLIYALVYSKLPYRGDPDYVIVLGSGLIGAQVPPLLASRLIKAREIHDQSTAEGVSCRIIVTGGQGADEARSEASAMAEYLIDGGVPADAVLIEDQARNTEENLRFSARLMAPAASERSSIVVTNNFHVFRAALLARRIGMDTQAVGSGTAGYFLPSAILREFAGLLAMYKWLHASLLALGLAMILAAMLYSFQ